MTRHARRGPENRKKHEATDWSELKKDVPQPPKSARDKKKGREHFVQKKQWKRKKLTAEGEILKTVLHKEQRRQQRRQKRAAERQSKQVCFNCRLPGHKLSECIMLTDKTQQGTGICFKCGSTEHAAAACKAKVAPGSYPFAQCFVCGQKGHISKMCPDNPRGLYPHGGSCKMCGSVEHFKRDCPEFLKEQGIGSATVERMDLASSVDEEVEADEPSSSSTAETKNTSKKKKKIVKF